MSWIEGLDLTAVVLAALYLVALGAASLVMPARATRFLLGFASSRPVHFAELSMRAAVGGALLIYAPHMLFSNAFNRLGWVLLITTACLLIVPWRWHHRFARYAVPLATRHTALVGLVSLAFGGLILAAVAHGRAA